MLIFITLSAVFLQICFLLQGPPALFGLVFLTHTDYKIRSLCLLIKAPTLYRDLGKKVMWQKAHTISESLMLPNKLMYFPRGFFFLFQTVDLEPETKMAKFLVSSDIPGTQIEVRNSGDGVIRVVWRHYPHSTHVPWVQILTRPLSSYETSGKLLQLSKPSAYVGFPWIWT